MQQQRDIGSVFSQTESGATLVNMFELGLIIGSGGVLSHAPRRAQAALMMIDAFQPLGVTQLAVDSIFMMPQLGVLAQVHPEIAAEVFRRDCLILLGPCIAPQGEVKDGEEVMTITLTPIRGTTTETTVRGGELICLPLGTDEKAVIIARPARQLDLGVGKGKPIEQQITGGTVGVILDGRGRPLTHPTDRNLLHSWLRAVGAEG